MSENDGIVRWHTCKKHKCDYIANCPRCEEERKRGIEVE